CVFNPDHNRGEAAIIVLVTGMLVYKCQHQSCAGKTWANVRDQLEPEARGRTAPSGADEHDADDGATGGAGRSAPSAEAKPPSQAASLVTLVAQAVLFHTPDQEAFATIVLNDHAETWALKSQGFRLWLKREFHNATGKIPSAQATQDAIQTLMG